MTKKTKLIIIISVVSVLLFSLFVAYLVMRHNGVGQDNILAYEENLPKVSSGFTYNGKEYVAFSSVWNLETDSLTDMGGYLWVCNHPYNHYATEMYADNTEDPIFIFAKAGDGICYFALKDFEFPSAWDATYSTAIISEWLSIQEAFSPAYENRLRYKFEFADSDGNPMQVKFIDILDPSSGLAYKDWPERFLEVGSIDLYWHDHPCLYLNYGGVYFDGINYYMSMQSAPGSTARGTMYYKIVNEQLIEYCQKVHLRCIFRSKC